MWNTSSTNIHRYQMHLKFVTTQKTIHCGDQNIQGLNPEVSMPGN
jgi:hypothetical protein